MTGFFQRYEYIKNIDKQHILDAFNQIQKIQILNELVIHIRCGDNWEYNTKTNCAHPGMPVLPIKFYENQLKENNLPVRFVCETLNDPYIKELQKKFPDAKFQSSSVLNDFITLLCAKKLIMSISTFFVVWSISK